MVNNRWWCQVHAVIDHDVLRIIILSSFIFCVTSSWKGCVEVENDRKDRKFPYYLKIKQNLLKH